jgi:hypothetical protein
MTEMGEEFRDDEDDVADLIAHFELLDTPEKMKKVLDGAKILLKNKVQEEKAEMKAAKVAEAKATMIAAKVAVMAAEVWYREPTESELLLTKGNSAEMIVVLEREYDFTGVPEFYQEQAKKWYKAEMPTSSRKLSKQMRSFNTVWLKWNLTATGGIPTNYKGYLIKKREESDGDAGVAMAAVRLE